ncbi:MAG: hypothetical protein WAL40_15915 [Rhodoplanes sp.]|jgi:hypothetical protein
MTTLDLWPDPLFEGDAEPGYSFFDWILHAPVGMSDTHAMRTRYRRRIHLPIRDPARPCARDVAARRAALRIN